MPLLEVHDLSVEYRVEGGTLRAVRGVSFAVEAGESLGLVGESGCGKTTTAKALVKVLPPNARIAGGSVRLNGEDLVPLPEDRMRAIRWKEISMVFQSAMNALDPVYRIRSQIAEAIRLAGWREEPMVRGPIAAPADIPRGRLAAPREVVASLDGEHSPSVGRRCDDDHRRDRDDDDGGEGDPEPR